MAEFKLTEAQLRTKADDLEQLNASFKGKIDSLEETEAALMGMWDGDAKEAFNRAFNNDKIQMTNFYNAIAQYVAVLRQVAANYAQAENTNVNTASTRNY